MNFSKQQKDNALIVLASLFLIAVIAFAYFATYAPVKAAKEQSEQTLSSERDVLMALQGQLKELPEGERINPLDLQQKVAVEPLTDKVLLQIEQAELLSGTLVQSIGFTEGPLELLAPVDGVENIQELLATVELEAYDYESITAFIKEIEAMKRIMVIEAINFSAYPEQTQQITEEEALAVSVQFSAFYRPDLISLVETAPKVDAPAPANKVDPMPQNDGTFIVTEASEEEELENEEDVEIDVEVEVDEEDTEQ
ncbi:pilus assembly protein PilO [Planococcus maritimus]|nr:pilus assembly protein PilO [Planococcus maritimus]